ncbi:MAG: histidine kinase [Thermoanaerobacteraceae bacterium]|nr:histidine kinase [Thermoanaerobacteraceae bacterium]
MEEKIKEVTVQLEDLKKRLPAHSLKPSMWAQLEELEEELECLQQLARQKEDQ